MTLLNESFLHHQGPTDVISFDYYEKGPPGELWGEIIVCTDEAILQARRFRTTWQSELVRYIVHGILHLNGYDDRVPKERNRMNRAENGLLRDLAVRFDFAAIDAR